MKVKKNLDKIIYDKMIESFILGEYHMGDMISLDMLCEKYEVSRTPVVQAIKLLANDGVLERLGNGRVVVPQFDAAQINDICDVRLMAEKYAIERVLADKEGLPSLLKQLEIYVKKCEEFLTAGNVLEMTKMDLKFHKALMTGAGNDYLSSIYDGIQGRFIIANYLVLPLKKRNFNSTIEDHYKILEALRKKDLKLAEKCMTKHINNIYYIISQEENTRAH